MAHPDEGGGSSARDGTWLMHHTIRWELKPSLGLLRLLVPSTVHHLVLGSHEGEGASGGNTKVVHRLRHEELTNRGAQHRPSVEASRERGGSCTLQLQFPPAL